MYTSLKKSNSFVSIKQGQPRWSRIKRLSIVVIEDVYCFDTHGLIFSNRYGPTSKVK